MSFKQYVEGRLNNNSNSELAFLKTIMTNPANLTTYLIYADWLEEKNDYFGTYLRTKLNQTCEEIQNNPDYKKLLQFEKRYLIDNRHKIQLINQPQDIQKTYKEKEYHDLVNKENPIVFRMLHAKNAPPESAWTWAHFPQNQKTFNIQKTFVGDLNEPHTVKNTHIDNALLSKHAIREFIVKLAIYNGLFKCWGKF